MEGHTIHVHAQPRAPCHTVYAHAWQPPHRSYQCQPPAEGKAEGKAEAALAMLRRRIARCTLTIDAARAEVDDLCREGDLTPDEAARISTRLG